MEIEVRPQHSQFVGSSKNGIRAKDSGNYLRSIAFIAGSRVDQYDM